MLVSMRIMYGYFHIVSIIIYVYGSVCTYIVFVRTSSQVLRVDKDPSVQNKLAARRSTAAFVGGDRQNADTRPIERVRSVHNYSRCCLRARRFSYHIRFPSTSACHSIAIYLNRSSSRQTSISPATKYTQLRPSKRSAFRGCTLFVITATPNLAKSNAMQQRRRFFSHSPDDFDLLILFGQTAFGFMAVLVVFGGQTLCTLLFGFAALHLDEKSKRTGDPMAQ